MSKNIKIKEFIANRLTQLDAEYQDCDDPFRKVKLSTMRTSFANIMNVYLGDDKECAISYLKHAETYFKTECFEQAIYYVQLSKKHSKNNEIIEAGLLLHLKSLLKLNKVEEANDLIKEIASDNQRHEFLEIKAEILEQMGKEQETMEVMACLEDLIRKKFSQESVEMGLHLIEKGRKKGVFNHFEEALQEMQKGLNTLIEVKYRDNVKTSKVYIQMAQFHRTLQNLESEYSSLVCAQSMIRQIPNKEKELIDLLHKMVVNLAEREEYQDSLKQLFKIEALEKHIYGESSSIVGKTIKKISETLVKMNKKVESKKYDQEYSRIISCNQRKGMNRDKPFKYVQIKNHH